MNIKDGLNLKSFPLFPPLLHHRQHISKICDTMRISHNFLSDNVKKKSKDTKAGFVKEKVETNSGGKYFPFWKTARQYKEDRRKLVAIFCWCHFQVYYFFVITNTQTPKCKCKYFVDFIAIFILYYFLCCSLFFKYTIESTFRSHLFLFESNQKIFSF